MFFHPECQGAPILLRVVDFLLLFLFIWLFQNRFRFIGIANIKLRFVEAGDSDSSVSDLAVSVLSVSFRQNGSCTLATFCGWRVPQWKTLVLHLYLRFMIVGEDFIRSLAVSLFLDMSFPSLRKAYSSDSCSGFNSVVCSYVSLALYVAGVLVGMLFLLCFLLIGKALSLWKSHIWILPLSLESDDYFLVMQNDHMMIRDCRPKGEPDVRSVTIWKLRIGRHDRMRWSMVQMWRKVRLSCVIMQYKSMNAFPEHTEVNVRNVVV